MHGRWLVVAATLTAVFVVAACNGDQPSAESGTPATSSSSPAPARPPSTGTPTSTATAGDAPAETPSPDGGPVTIAFAGDMHFEGVLRARLDDPANALAPIAAQLGAADVTVVNFESAVGTSGIPEPNKRYIFRAPPSALTALAAAGVDVVTMANNHGMDYGPDGLADTLDAAAQARADGTVQVVGVGADAAQAFAPAVVDVRGTTVAVIGASQPDDPTSDPTAQWAATDTAPGIATALDPALLLRAVRQASGSADIVVVYLHWGIQGESCPSPSQASLAAALADAGADVVVGSHAHRLQGGGLLGGAGPGAATYVAYGLGNFVWYSRNSDAAVTTGVLTVTVDGGRVTREAWAPARIGEDGLPAFASGPQARQLTAERDALRDCTGLSVLE